MIRSALNRPCSRMSSRVWLYRSVRDMQAPWRCSPPAGRARCPLSPGPGAGPGGSIPVQYDLAAAAGFHQVEPLLEFRRRELVAEHLVQREAADYQLG